MNMDQRITRQLAAMSEDEKRKVLDTEIGPMLPGHAPDPEGDEQYLRGMIERQLREQDAKAETGIAALERRVAALERRPRSFTAKHARALYDSVAEAVGSRSNRRCRFHEASRHLVRGRSLRQRQLRHSRRRDVARRGRCAEGLASWPRSRMETNREGGRPMTDVPITYCGGWSEEGPAKRITLQHIDAVELDALNERARTSCLAAGITKPSELDRAIAETLFGQLEAIEQDREAKAQAAAEVEAKRAHLRLIEGGKE